MTDMAPASMPAAEDKKRGGDLVASRIVKDLREEILVRGEGAFLGSEEDLLHRFGVSRPTFRQTARVLENEQLLIVKRGVRGGYYARRPSMVSVGSATAAYLRSRNTSLADLLEASRSAVRAIARLAARSSDLLAREALRLQTERMRRLTLDVTDVADFNMEDRELAARLGALSGNPPLELFVATLYHVGLEASWLRVFEDKPERLTEYRQRRLQLAEAVLAGDPEMAELLQDRTSRQMIDWLEADLEAEHAEDAIGI